MDLSTCLNIKFNQGTTLCSYLNFEIAVSDDLERLVLTERIETLVPITYLATMAMAYYGPNAELMGSVKLQIWQHQNVIEDFGDFATNILILFAVDFVSFIINGFIIWKICKINLLRVLFDIQKRYWYIMIFIEAYMLNEVSINVSTTVVKVNTYMFLSTRSVLLYLVFFCSFLSARS